MIVTLTPNPSVDRTIELTSTWSAAPCCGPRA